MIGPDLYLSVFIIKKGKARGEIWLTGRPMGFFPRREKMKTLTGGARPSVATESQSGTLPLDRDPMVCDRPVGDDLKRAAPET